MSDSKPVYCPLFEEYLESCKPKLKEKIRTHLDEREIALSHAVTSVSKQLQISTNILCILCDTLYYT